MVVGQIDKSAIVEGDMCGIFRQNQVTYLHRGIKGEGK